MHRKNLRHWMYKTWQLNRQNVKKQLCQILLYIKEGLEIVANAL